MVPIKAQQTALTGSQRFRLIHERLMGGSEEGVHIPVEDVSNPALARFDSPHPRKDGVLDHSAKTLGIGEVARQGSNRQIAGGSPHDLHQRSGANPRPERSEMGIERSGGEGDALLQFQSLRPLAAQVSASSVARLDGGAVEGPAKGDEPFIQLAKEGEGRISTIIEGLVARCGDVPDCFIDMGLSA